MYHIFFLCALLICLNLAAGQRSERSHASRTNKQNTHTRYGAGILPYFKDQGKIFFVIGRTSPMKAFRQKNRDIECTDFGGKRLPNETCEQNAVREYLEESLNTLDVMSEPTKTSEALVAHITQSCQSFETKIGQFIYTQYFVEIAPPTPEVFAQFHAQYTTKLNSYADDTIGDESQLPEKDALIIVALEDIRRVLHTVSRPDKDSVLLPIIRSSREIQDGEMAHLSRACATSFFNAYKQEFFQRL